MFDAASTKENSIILNKPFVGGYIDQSNENEAHELINFFLDDKGNHFIYCNPYGQNVRDAADKLVEYVLFTSSAKAGCFYIEYIVEIGATLHSQSLPKPTDRNRKAIDSKIFDAMSEIEENIKNLGYKAIEDIQYGGISLNNLFTDSIQVIPLTFLAENIYRLKNPIKIEGNSEIFDYNFQRNFGYVTEKSKSPKAYKELKEKIKAAIDQQQVNKLTLEKFNLNDLKGRSSQAIPTFMDLISMYRQEECYTQILYKLFNHKKGVISKFLRAINEEYENTPMGEEGVENKEWHVESEYAIKNVGRLDLFIYNDNYNIIIENKIDSGINYVSKDEEKIDQLTRYYKYFEDPEQKGIKKNIYLIFAPNEKTTFIKAEIKSIGNDKVATAFKIIEYKQIYEFFKKHENEYSNFEYIGQFKNILEVFRRLSLTRQEMCEENLLQNICKIRHIS